MKTLKELSSEMGIQKQRLYRYIKNNHMDEVVVDQAGLWLIDENLAAKLCNHFIESGSDSDANDDAEKNTGNEVVLLEMIDVLKSQLATKDQQISELTKAVINGQIIQRDLHNQIALLSAPQNHDAETESNQNVNQDANKDTQKDAENDVVEVNRKSFFGRLFGR